MFVVTEAVSERLGELARRATSHGRRRIFRKDVVAALIALKAPTQSTQLARLLNSYFSPGHGGSSPLLQRPVHIMVTLPCPISHRLDAIVAAAREGLGERVTRSDIVAALVLKQAPTTPQTLHKLHVRYVALSAADTALPGQDPSEVLSRRRPAAGLRPLRGSTPRGGRRRTGGRRS
jgi:hypothetical protein